jgi:UDP-4-amino-4,6-dideoxy-N-acetyl-beta-L-altrosamine N-acetyltransferase
MLRGNLVNLVALEATRLEVVRKWRTSPDVYEYLFDFQFISPEQQKNWYEKTLSDPGRQLLLIEDQQANPLGLVQLARIDFRNRSAEWGFFIGNTESRYGGHAAETEFLVLKYAFDYLNLNKLYCFTFAFNQKVLSVHSRFGFQTEGVLKEHIYHRGKYEDVVIMSIFRHNYQGVQDYYGQFFARFQKRAKRNCGGLKDESEDQKHYGDGL